MGKGKAQTRCYNSGKISKLPYLVAYENFRRADGEIKDMGLTPINPMRHGLKPSYTWFMHILFDLCLLVTCRHIFLQSNWQDSRGAKIEYKVARLIGMQFWLQENPGCEK